MFQERLNKIKEFFQSIEMVDGSWVICMKYKPKWAAYGTADGRIEVAPDDNVPDVWWYFSKHDGVGVDDILDLIEENIQTNLDAVAKLELFKKKAEELKALFSDEKVSLQRLKTLRLVMDDITQPPVEKFKQTKKNVKPQQTQSKKTTPKPKPAKVEAPVVEYIAPEPAIEEPKEAVSATNMSSDEIDALRG